MNNYEGLMDPAGNTGYGTSIYGMGTLGALLAGGAEHFLVGKTREKKVMKKALDKAGIIKTHAENALSNRDIRRTQVLDKAITKRLLGRTEPTIKLKTIDRWSSYNTKLAVRNQVVSDARKITSSLASDFKYSRRVLKGIGWLSLATDALALGAWAVTPGPSLSARAQQVESSFMTNQAVFSGGMTSRQRALQAIHDSQLAINPILGNESNYLHK